jgi:nucleoporin POM152
LLYSVKRIHPIPTAQVSEGDSVVVDIREGDQTEIIFSFTGTPPFAFTYSRRRPQDRSKDKTVLETHTVT